MRAIRTGLVALAILLGHAAAARADVSAFLGRHTTPDSGPLRGFAGGVGLLVVAFEFEYAGPWGEPSATAPTLRTFSGNMLLQTPMMIHGVQPYFTIGGGLYRERLGTHVDTGFAPNSGAGLKIRLAGPLRLRLDYRAFRLGSDALSSPAHRFYGGLNLKF